MAGTERGHKADLAPGFLLKEKNGWRLFQGRDCHYTARGGTKETKRNRIVVVAPDGSETFLPNNSEGLEQANHWFDIWSRRG